MVPVANVNPAAMAGSLGAFFYGVLISLIKISALLLYARIFRSDRKMVRVLWGAGAVVIAWSFVIIIYPWTECHPYKKLLYPLVPGKCDERRSWYLGATAFNTILDFFILLLPVPMVWSLQMPVRKKLGYVFIFLLGYW
jgi:hypothetical protein